MSNTGQIRLLIVEDDPDWIKALSVFLNQEQDFLIVGTAQDREQAIRLAQTIQYDIVLMDIQLGDEPLGGVYTAMELYRLQAAKIIMLTSHTEEAVKVQAFSAGALNYLEKARFRELPAAVRAAYHHPETMQALLKELHRLKREEQLAPLSKAEREVFELIESGHTQGQIERKLFKAESTIKNQVNKMLKKLGVRSSKEAVDKVKSNGLFRK